MKNLSTTKNILLLAGYFILSYAIAQPTITAFSPINGPVGTTITITGTNFNTIPANNVVIFGATRAAVISASTTSLVATVSSEADNQPIDVLEGEQKAYSSKPFEITTENNFTINTTSLATNTDISKENIAYGIAIDEVEEDRKVDVSNGTVSFGTLANDIDSDGKSELATVNKSKLPVSVILDNTSAATFAQYSFSGGNANDDSGNGFNGTASAGAQFTTDRFGYTASSFEPRNDGKYIEVNHGGNWNLNGEVVISAWIRANSFAPGSGASEFWDVVFDGTQNSGELIIQAGEILYSWFANSAVNIVRTNPNVINLKVWSHVLVRINSQNEISIFVNGVIQEISLNGGTSGTGLTIPRGVATPQIAYIGNKSSAATDNRWFDGSIDDVRVYTGSSLTDQEILDIYNSEKPEDLRVQFPFISGALTSANGYGYSGQSITSTGTPTTIATTTDRLGNASGALLFQNTGNQVQVIHERSLNLRNNVTVNMWVRPTALPLAPSFGDVLINDNANGRLAIFPNGGMAYHYPANGGTSYPTLSTPAGLMTANVWKMVTLSISDGDIVKIYVNGQLQSLTKNGSSTDGNISDYTSYGNPDRFILAQADVAGTDNRYYNGAIDDVSIFQHVLTDGQILKLFDGIGDEIPLAPQITYLGLIAPDAVRLRWQDISELEEEYQVKVFTFDGSQNIDEVYFSNLPANTTQLDIFELVPGTLYNFEVIAVNRNGSNLSSETKQLNALQKPVVTVSPAVFTLDDEITLTYYPDRSYAEGSLVGVSPIYIHSGLLTPDNVNTGSWSNVVGNWGQDDGVGRMTSNGDGSWSITFVPRTYYNLSIDFVAAQIGMVFRNADGTLDGKDEYFGDIFIDVFNSDLLQRPEGNYVTFSNEGRLVNYTNDIGNENAYLFGNEVTMEAWILLSDLPQINEFWDVISRRISDSNPYYSYKLSVINDGNNTNGPSFELSITNGSEFSYLVGRAPITSQYQNRWIHLAGVIDGTFMTLFLNGEQVAQVSQLFNFPTGIITGVDRLEIGGSGFKGGVDEVRLWNSARTRDQIVQNSQIVIAGNTQGLNGYWRLERLENDGRSYFPDESSFVNRMYIDGNVKFEALPDLAAEIVSITPSIISQENTATAVVSINNIGEAAVQSPFQVRLYLSQDDFFSQGLPQLTTVTQSGTVAARGSLNFNVPFNIPLATAIRDYFVFAEVDATNVILEVNETNNISQPVEIAVVAIGVPVLQAASDVTVNQFRINWQSVVGADGYRYSVSTNDDFTNILPSHNNVLITTTNVLITGLNPATTYHYRVNAVKSGASGAFASSSATTSTIGVPVLQAATDIAVNQFRINWQSVAGADGYRYSVSTNSGFTNILPSHNNVSVTATSVLISGLNPATTYHYRVNAVKAGANGAFANASSTTLADNTPPGLPSLVFNNELNTAANVVVTINNVLDNVGVTSVNMFVRGAGEADSQIITKPAQNTQGTTWTATIAVSDFDAIGATFYIVVSDLAGNTVATPRNTARILQISTSSPVIVPSNRLGKGAEVNNYVIFSSPYNSTPVSTIFKDLGDRENDTKWRIATLNSGRLPYEFNPTNILPGRGYWLLNNTGKDEIRFSGVKEASLNGKDYFEITLVSGWNMIGNPFHKRSLNWAQVVQFNIENNNFTAGVVSQLFVHNSSFSSATSLGAFQGAFIRSTREGVRLQIPLSASSATAREDQSLGIPRDYFVENGGWETVMTFETAGWRMGAAGFGEMPEASNGPDELDYPLIPAFNEGLHVSFNSAELETTMMRDIRSVQDDNSWKFDFQTHLPEGTLFTINFNGNPVVNSGQKVVLFDHKHQKMVEVNDNNQYKFAYVSGMSFTVVKGDDVFIEEQLLPQSIIIGDVYPNPISNGQFNVALSLPRIAGEIFQVTLLLNDISGKLIKSIESVSLTEGRHSIAVNLNSEENTDGIYLLNIQVSSPSGKTMSYYQRVYLEN